MWGIDFLLAIILLIPLSVFAEPRLVDHILGPDIAARGSTGIAECQDLACLENNPALLYSDDEEVKIFAAVDTRFNQALFETVDDWDKTTELFSSKRYREILLKAWTLMSQQTARIGLGAGIRLKSFAIASAGTSGVNLFTHDPVLPYIEIYPYAAGGFYIGYAFRFMMPGPLTKHLSVGAVVKHHDGTTAKYVLNRLDNDFSELENIKMTWVNARLGATLQLKTRLPSSLSATLSGIPLYGRPLPYLPANDSLDLGLGATAELGQVWWIDLKGFYSLSRITRSESFWLKNHLGFEMRFGRFRSMLGINDLMPSYGISLDLALFKFSATSYGLSYSSLAGDVTDRIYWLQVEF